MGNDMELLAKLRRLHVDRSHGSPAPHKPLMLLALLDLFEQGHIPENRIKHEPRLIERFSEYWKVLNPRGFQFRSWLPFFHLRRDKFWQLTPKTDSGIDLKKLISPKSTRQLHDAVSHATLSEEAWSAFKSADARAEIRELLIRQHFKEEDQVKLRKAIQNENLLAKYCGDLISAAADSQFILKHNPTVLSPTMRRLRAGAFRRLVRNLYDDTCCMCELRLVTNEGKSVLEGSHIVPYSVSFNDDPRNGIGLCPVHHWCFDEGLVGVSPEYKVIVSESLDPTRPTEERLLEIRGQRIKLPKEARMRPARESLVWHAKSWSLAC